MRIDHAIKNHPQWSPDGFHSDLSLILPLEISILRLEIKAFFSPMPYFRHRLMMAAGWEMKVGSGDEQVSIRKTDQRRKNR
jgi:hypothetical protein